MAKRVVYWVLWGILSLLGGVTMVWGGGPLSVKTDGTPYAWSSSEPVVWNPDQGGLGKLKHREAVELVASSFKAWEDVSTCALTFAQGEELSADVVASNFNQFVGHCDQVSPIVFDADGSIIDSMGGQGASCLFFGFASPECVSSVAPTIVEGFAVINGAVLDGNFANCENSYDDTVLTMIHEFGHMLGLAHSQVNGNQASLIRYVKGFESFGIPPIESVEIMYPFAIPGNVLRAPVADDRAWISWLNPTPDFATTTGTIQGSVFEPDGTTPLQGVNLVARNKENPFFDAVSSVSGDRHRSTQAPEALKNAYQIPGLTPGANDVVNAEEINPAFRGGSSIPPKDPPLDVNKETDLAFLEFYNGENEAGENPPDDPDQFVEIPVIAGTPVENVHFSINYKTTQEQSRCEGVSFDAVNPDDVLDPASAQVNFIAHNTSETTDQGTIFTADPLGVGNGIFKFRDNILDFNGSEATGIDDEDVYRIYWGDISNAGEILEIIIVKSEAVLEQPLGIGGAIGLGVYFKDYKDRVNHPPLTTIGGAVTYLCLKSGKGECGFQGGFAEMIFPIRDLPSIPEETVAQDTIQGNFETVISNVSSSFTHFGNGNAFGKFSGTGNIDLNNSEENSVNALSYPNAGAINLLIGDFSQAEQQKPLITLFIFGEINPNATFSIPDDVLLFGWRQVSDFFDGDQPLFEGCSGNVTLYPETQGKQLNQRFLGEFEAFIGETGTCNSAKLNIKPSDLPPAIYTQRSSQIKPLFAYKNIQKRSASQANETGFVSHVECSESSSDETEETTGGVGSSTDDLEDSTPTIGTEEPTGGTEISTASQLSDATTNDVSAKDSDAESDDEDGGGCGCVTTPKASHDGNSSPLFSWLLISCILLCSFLRKMNTRN